MLRTNLSRASSHTSMPRWAVKSLHVWLNSSREIRPKGDRRQVALSRAISPSCRHACTHTSSWPERYLPAAAWVGVVVSWLQYVFTSGNDLMLSPVELRKQQILRVRVEGRKKPPGEWSQYWRWDMWEFFLSLGSLHRSLTWLEPDC